MNRVRGGTGGRLGRRLLSLLVVATWFPLALLSWTFLREYELDLAREAASRLADRAKDSGLEIFGRLNSLRADLEVAASGLGGADPVRDLLAGRERWRDRFAVLVATPAESAPAAWRLPGLQPEAAARLRERRDAMLVERRDGEAHAVWIVSPLNSSSSAIVWGRVRLEWLWPEAAEESHDGEGWVLLGTDRRRPIATSLNLPAGLLSHLDALGESARDGFEWRDAAGRRYLVRFWTVPLGYELGYSGLTVLISEPYRLAESVTAFRRVIYLVALGALLTVALIGIRRLRSDLGPLERLAESARLIAGGNLATRVPVNRRDEVGRLSVAFNRMAEDLERQFHQVESARSIAASALVPAPSAEEVARVFVEQANRLVGEVEIVVVLAGAKGDSGRAYSTDRSKSPEETFEAVRGLLPPSADRAYGEWESGRSNSVWRTLRRGDQPLAFVGMLGAEANPLDELADRLNRLRGPCDQLALALGRVKLLGDLERANWGALTALARAVDAKSPWTHGHSIRVARIAVALAREEGYSESEVGRIRRGCLVHDVGKIGVPSAVLDKPSQLTAEEIALLRSHVEKGARILEPVEGLGDVLPIVWQHHERLDGSGYPKGLRGGEIDPVAALVAVADVYEALTVARPYRAAWSAERVEGYLRGLADVQFAPRSVDALFRIRERYESWIDPAESATSPPPASEARTAASWS